jgi:hypothetical protein
MGATDLASPSPDIRRARIPVSQEGEWFVDGAETNEWFSDFSDVFKHPPSPLTATGTFCEKTNVHRELTE